jgi:cell division septal protein FtsQ
LARKICDKLLEESLTSEAGKEKFMSRELVKVEVYLMPIRLRLIREVIPLLGVVFSLGLVFGYFWAMKAYSSFY